MAEQPLSKELKEKIEDIGLTDQQTNFVNYYLFITDLDPMKAVELAGYSHGVALKDDADPLVRDNFIRMRYQARANELLKNPKVIKYIKLVKDEMAEQCIVDKLYVIKKLKDLVEKGGENTKLRALELLGKHLLLFTEVVQTNQVEDAASIARASFENRKNIIEMNKQGEGTNG